jgi:ferredoxin
MVKVDKNQCIGCGLCVSLCSEVFQMNKDNKAEVKAQKKKPCVKEAISSCPVNAIGE